MNETNPGNVNMLRRQDEPTADNNGTEANVAQVLEVSQVDTNITPSQTSVTVPGTDTNKAVSRKPYVPPGMEPTIIEDYKPPRHYGKYVFILIIILAAFYFTKGFSFNSEPTLAEVVPALRSYLMERTQKDCDGNVEVTVLTDVSIGKFEKTFGNEPLNGWPVYASHQEVCDESGKKFTYNGLNNSKDKVVTGWVRKNSLGRVEFFTPKFMLQMEKELESVINGMINKF